MRASDRKVRSRPVTSPLTTTTSSGDIALPAAPHPVLSGETTVDFELSHHAFHELWRHFQLGTKPTVLNVLPDGVTQSEREEAERRAWDELRQHGIHDRDRADDLYGVLLPLHRYERAFDITYRYLAGGENRRKSGLVASSRQSATLAVQSADKVRISVARPDDMLRALLSVLPEVHAGPGKGVSVRTAQFNAAASESDGSNRAMSEGLTRQGVRRDDVRALMDMAGSQRIAFAQFGANMMDGYGKRKRAAMVTNCFANANGWYLLEESRRGSEPWTTLAPVDKQRMGGRIQELLKAIPGE